jgi:hypothetical protein
MGHGWPGGLCDEATDAGGVPPAWLVAEERQSRHRGKPVEEPKVPEEQGLEEQPEAGRRPDDPGQRSKHDCGEVLFGFG